MYLLDTHVLVWLATGDKRLSRAVGELLTTPDIAIFVSVVSEWELVLKQRTSSFRLPVPFDLLVERSTFACLDLAFGTPRLVESLPAIHDDPFDRILIAQALYHGYTLVTRDGTIRKYPVPTFW